VLLWNKFEKLKSFLIKNKDNTKLVRIFIFGAFYFEFDLKKTKKVLSFNTAGQ